MLHPRPSWHLAVLAGLGLLAYSNSFGVPFLFDDGQWILRNERIQSLATSLEGTNRPLLSLSLAFNFGWSGKEVYSYHLVNLLIHVAAACVLCGLARRTLARTMWSNSANALGLCIAALWIAHPLQTQSVTYVIQRSESLAGLFYLTTLYCIARASTSNRPGLWCVFGTACVWLGLGAKETLATVPIVAALYDRAFFAPSWRALVRSRWAFYLGAVSSWAWLASGVVSTTAAPHASVGASQPFSGLEYLLSQPEILLHYLRLCFWPVDLCLDYYWSVSRDPVRIAICGAMVLTLVATAVVLYRRRPQASFLVLAPFLILAPTSTVFPLADLAVEHRMYLPLAAVLSGTVLTVSMLLPHAARARRVIAVGTCALLCALTLHRNFDYASVERIWSTVLEVNPDNPRAYNEIGRVREAEGEHDHAHALYRRAMQASDRSDMKPLAPYHYNLGIALHRVSALEEAAFHYRRALFYQPRSTTVLLNLGTALWDLGDVEGAVREYEHLVKIKPDYSPAHNNIAIARSKSGMYREAAESYRRAIEGNPAMPGLRLTLARTLLKIDEVDEAMAEYEVFAREQLESGLTGSAWSCAKEALDAAQSLQHANWTRHWQQMLTAVDAQTSRATTNESS